MLLTLAKLRLFFETTKHFIKKVQTAAAIRTWYVTKESSTCYMEGAVKELDKIQ